MIIWRRYGTGGRSLDGLTPRAQLAADLEHALRERDDLKQQVTHTHKCTCIFATHTTHTTNYIYVLYYYCTPHSC